MMLLTQSRNHVKIMFRTALRDRQELYGTEFAANNGIKSFSRSERQSFTLRKSYEMLLDDSLQF